jgi:multidrug efflux pump subunit AcrB
MADPDPGKAAAKGTSEVALAITAGMLTTVIVLIPVMFSGGYSQRILRPLSIVIASTLAASLLAALTIIPLAAAKLLGRTEREPNRFERLLGYTDRGVKLLADFYVLLLRFALRWRIAVLIFAVVLLGATRKVVLPLIGAELMPPMDTGVALIDFDTPTDFNARLV